MGALTNSFGNWVRAMNASRNTQEAVKQRNAALTLAHDAILDAVIDEANWDAVDRQVWQILLAIDKSQAGV